MEQMSGATPVPLKKVCLLGLILAANNTSVWMIFSFLPFMVQFYFPDLSVAELGYRAGMLGSAFSGGSLIGNLFWGIISDRFGRRPALLCGLVGTGMVYFLRIYNAFLMGFLLLAISCICFGFSPTFLFAVISRFMWGLLNGNIGVAKTYLAEISDDSNSAKGMALFGVIGGFGRSIGPIIGGFLSSPAKLFPSVFGGTIFETFPFALPALIIATNCLVVFVVAFFSLAETLPSAMETTTTALEHTSSKSSSSSIMSSPMQSQPRKTYALLQNQDDEDFETEDADDDDDDEETTTNGRSQMSPMVELLTIQKRKNEAIYQATKANEVIDADGESFLAVEEEENKEYMLSSSPTDCHDEFRRQSSKKKRLTFASVVTVKVIGSKTLGYGPLKGVDEHDEPLMWDEQQVPPSPVPSPLNINGNGGSNGSHIDGGDIEAPPDHSSSSLLTPPTSKHIGKVRYSNGSEDTGLETRKRTLYRMLVNISHQPEVMISTLMYGTNAMAIIVFNEIFPLWIVTSKDDGGFDFTSSEIGISTMICGFVGIVLQLTLYPYMTDRLGVLQVHRYGVLSFAICCILAPCMSLVNSMHSKAVIWIVVVLSQLIIQLSSTWVLVSVFVLINNSCYAYQRSTVNGVGQTFASLGRLCGPYLGANLFAWSENNKLRWPLNYYLAFYVMGSIGLFNWYLSTKLPRSILRRKKEPGHGKPSRSQANAKNNNVHRQNASKRMNSPFNIEMADTNSNNKLIMDDLKYDAMYRQQQQQQQEMDHR